MTTRMGNMEAFNIKNMGEFHDSFLKTDVLLLPVCLKRLGTCDWTIIDYRPC